MRKGPTKRAISEEKEIEIWSLSHLYALIKLCLKLSTSKLLVEQIYLVSQYIPFLKDQIKQGFCYLKQKNIQIIMFSF